MHKFLVLAGMLLVSSVPAFAADLIIPSEIIPSEPKLEAMGAYDWSGFYVGASFGGQNVGIVSVPDDIPGGMGLLAGGFAGYNVQYDQVVFGIEADLYYSTFSASEGCFIFGILTCSSSIEFQGSARARVGFAADSVLFYLTGGIAAARFDGAVLGFVENFPDSEILLGYTVGAGIEVGLSQSITGRVEYRYTNYGPRDFTFDIPYPGIDVDAHALTIGIAYKF